MSMKIIGNSKSQGPSVCERYNFRINIRGEERSHMFISTESNEQFLYLTTIGRKTGLRREIEIWFVERRGRLYCLAEHGRNANWVRNILANPSVTIRLAERSWRAIGRVLDPEGDADVFAAVQSLARQKYDWGDGLPVEFQLEQPENT
jgi:deazaflavin-dependent oxidoreductase (nitroreductase family)